MTAAAASRAFAVWFRDLERWDVAFYRQVRWHWPPEVIRPLGTALVRKRVEVDAGVEPVTLPIIQKITFGGVVSVTSPNERIGYKGRLFWADAGDFVYSKIRVKQGSLAVIPAEIGRIAVSPEYPVYAVDEQRADGRYLELVVRSGVFLHLLSGIAHGGSTKTRIPPEEFERLTIPLPTLCVQRAIIAAWEAAQRELAATRTKIAELEERIEADFLADLGLSKPARATLPKCFAVRWKDFWRWGVQPNQLAAVSIDVSRAKYPTVRGLECLLEVKHGCSASPSPKPTGLDVLKISAVTRGEFRPEERKHAFDRPRFRREFDLKAGDVLMCRTNGTLGLVGMSALVESDMPDLIYPDKVIRVRVRDILLPAYFWRAVQAPLVRLQIEYAARTAVGNYAIGSDDILNLEFPLPPLDVQRRITARVETTRAEIAALRTAAAEREQQAKAEVEAMILGERRPAT